MTKYRDIRSYDYVNRPYDQVRDALTEKPLEIFRAATTAASERAESIASELHVKLAGLDVGADINIEVEGVEERPGELKRPATTVIRLAWEAAQAPRLFPLMKAELAIYRLSATETQLDFSGHYQPPMQALGSAIDAVVGHRIAEASVHRFLKDIASHLRQTLTR